MGDPFFDDIDSKQEQIEDEEFKQCDLVRAMVATDGWEIVKKRLEDIQNEHMVSLLNLPIVPDHLGEIALAQSKVNACRMLFDIIKDFTDRREAIKDPIED